MEQGKEHPAAVDSDPNHVAANVVVAPPLPPTITNPVFNNAKRAAHEEPQQVMCTKKHKTDVQSNFMEYQHHCQHNKAEVPLCTKSSTTQSAKQENTSSNQFQQDDEDYNSKMKNSQHITLKRSVSVDMPPDKKSMATTQDSHKGSISNELLEDGDETFKEIYEHTPDNIALKLNNKLLDHSERLDLAIERTIHPATTSHATGSKTLYLGNLSFAVEEDDVRDFFKDVGEIAAIRFAIRDDRFLGYGHIEFTTSEAAQEALKLNKEVLYDRRVKLDLARERGTYPPGNSMVKYNSTGGQAQRKTVFVRGFRSSDGFDIIGSALEKHFRKCGEISRLAIPKDYDGAPKGIAFIDFVDTIGFRRALGLDGSVVSGNRLTVEVANKSDVREGSGCGGRGWSLKSGSSGGWVRENGSGWGRGNGSIRGWGREIGYAGGVGRESILGPGPCRESGSASGCEKCFASSSCRESAPASTSRPESGSASTSSRESCHGSSLLRKIDFDGGPRRRNCFGSGPPRGNGFNSGPPRGIDFCSGPPRGNGFGCGPPRGRGVGRSWHAEIGFGRGSGIDIRSDSSWHRESSSRIGRCGVSGYGRHDRGR
uniref:nucleolin 2-like n=1 Tax=Erigeron canadensis TaxID=72917 RepID=UPI001CB8F629|nr:nucleolin 2-like [Erigeron canadensis]